MVLRDKETGAPKLAQQDLFDLLAAQLADVQPVLQSVAVADLPADDDLRCEPPGQELQDSVRLWQRVLQPIGLVGDPDGGYELAWGRRRTMAARRAGLLTVPAIVYPSGTPTWVLTLAENNARSENVQSDLWALQQASVFSQEEAALLGGMSAETLKARLRIWNNLDARLIALWQEGKLTAGVALHASKLRAAQQDALYADYQERVRTADTKRVRITKLDVRNVTRLAAMNAAVRLAPVLAAATTEAVRTGDPVDTQERWESLDAADNVADEALRERRQMAMALLLPALECLPAGDKVARLALEHVIHGLETGQWDKYFLQGVLHNMRVLAE